MLAGVFLVIDLSQWAEWAPVAVGVLFAVVVVIVGVILVGRRRKVVHTRSSADRRRAGAAPEDEDHDPFDYGSPEDKRAAPRRQGKPVAVLIAVEGTAEPRRGTVLDRSVGGLRLAVGSPLDVGAVVNLRVAHAVETIPWVPVEVKNCRQTPNGWEAGCQFLQTPPASVMWLFG
jgi:hypothetical protein